MPVYSRIQSLISHCVLGGMALFTLTLLPVGQLHADSCEPVARLVSLEGAIEYKIANTENWNPAVLEQEFCNGDAIRSGRDSRAALRMINETLLRLDHSTAIIFTSVVQKERSLLDLLKGALHFISRVPRSLEVNTPYLNAAIEGTEFVIKVKDESTEVTVYEGKVVASNTSGSIDLTANQAGSATSGQAPIRTAVARPRDAVAWTLYYPPLPVQQDQAGMLAQQTIDAIVRNDIDQAATLAQQAIANNPQSASAYMAQSYVDQARFDIPRALENSRKAAELAPQDAITQARLAEVLLMTGDTNAAKIAANKAVRIDPLLAHTQTVLGFSSLRDVNLDDAESAFKQAIRLDSAAPLPHLGLGLVKIRRGDLTAGREEIETASLLDPNNALLRSYMGKAYYEEKRGKLASEQFAMAKQLDPNDPTAWFYNSILLQTSNQPVKALKEIDAAVSRNDNRGVYRSSQLLDEDNASRNISLARIYDDLGFEELAIVEASISLTDDPANYSAHRLIADSFATRPRHEKARASELLQSQLLQPLNINSAQPRLAETNLNILPGLVQLQTGYNEYNPLFDQNTTLFNLSGNAGSNDTFGDEFTVSGIQDDIGFSLGQFHFETDGSRENKNAKYDIYNFFLQKEISSESSIQAEIRHTESKTGDLVQRFNSDSFSPDKTVDVEDSSLRLGYHLKPQQYSDVIVSAIYTEDSETTLDNTISVYPDGFTISSNDEIHLESDIYQFEAQYIQKMDTLRLIAGAGYFESDIHELITIRDTLIDPVFGTQIIDPVTTTKDEKTRHSNGYLYLNIDINKNLSLITGISIDSIQDDSNDTDNDQLNPKLGLQWDVTNSTTLRAAAFRNLSRNESLHRSIEMTNIAGFNQLFDDPVGSDTRRYGVAIDHNFSTELNAGIELSKRDIESTLSIIQGQVSSESVGIDEFSHRAYLYWSSTDNVSIGTEIHYEKNEREYIPSTANTMIPNKTTTLEMPIFIHYFHPKGWFSKLIATYIDQEVEFSNINGGTDSDDNQFWLMDASLGYRLPKRNGIISLEARNLLDKDFKYQETDLFGKQRLPRYEPDQTLLLRFTLSF